MEVKKKGKTISYLPVIKKQLDMIVVELEFGENQKKEIYSGKFRAFRTPIPGDFGHEFRINSDSDSGLIPDSFML